MILRALVLSQEGRRDCPLSATNIAWMRGERSPGFMDALMPLACLPVPIAGRNRIWRKMLIDSVRSDPEWMNGDYTQQPHGLTTAIYFLMLAGSSPLQMQKAAPAPQSADEYLAHAVNRPAAHPGPHSRPRHPQPSPGLGRISRAATKSIGALECNL